MSSNTNTRKALQVLATASAARLHGWATVYRATATALGMEGVTVKALADGMKEEGNPWTAKGLSAVSEETLRSYVSAATITAVMSDAVSMCATVANGDLHKKVATAKASGVPTAKITAWVKATVSAIEGAADDEAKAKAVKAAVDTLNDAAKAAKDAKAAKASGPAKGDEGTDAADTATAPATAPATIADLLQAAAGPVGAAAKRIASGETLTADDAAAIRTLGAMVGGMLKAVKDSEAKAS